jgi:hypothetical protein
MLADINSDGLVNVLDIDPFVLLLTWRSGQSPISAFMAARKSVAVPVPRPPYKYLIIGTWAQHTAAARCRHPRDGGATIKAL